MELVHLRNVDQMTKQQFHDYTVHRLQSNQKMAIDAVAGLPIDKSVKESMLAAMRAYHPYPILLGKWCVFFNGTDRFAVSRTSLEWHRLDELDDKIFEEFTFITE